MRLALAAVVLRMFLRRLAGPASASLWAVGWLLPPALLLEPVRSTLAYGQVNIVLMALVALDCLAVAPRWPRGALTGVAAAMKLTPAAFVLFFLLRRDYRAAAVAPGRWRRDEAFSQVLYLIPDEMAGMAEVIRAVIAQYRHREARPTARPPEAAPVAIVARLFPLLEPGVGPALG